MKQLEKDLKDYTLRVEQIDTLAAMNEHSDKKFFIGELPPGVGKSVLIMTKIKEILENDKYANFDVITYTKILQEQYFNEFKSISNLWGMDNYVCSTHANVTCQTGSLLNSALQKKCDNCPYEIAKDEYVRGKISLTNFYLFSISYLFDTQVNKTRKAKYLIIDEAHEFESVYQEFLSVRITQKYLEYLGIENVSDIMNGLRGLNDISDAVNFIRDEYKPALVLQKMRLEDHFKNGGDINVKRIKKLTGKNKTPKSSALMDLNMTINKINIFLDEYDKDNSNWIFDKNLNGDLVEIHVEPKWIHNYLKNLWSKYDKVIMMSGTFLGKDITCYVNGIDPDDAFYYSIDSPYPAKNRPFYIMPVEKMNYNNKQMAFDKFVPFVNKLLKKYENKKGIIHTVNYELSNWTKEQVLNNRLIFPNAKDKAELLQYHYNSSQPTVLVSPSLTTGVDFVDDRARFQILLKVPYPSLASKKIKFRQQDNPQWYIWKTIQAIIQTYGRAVRNYDDSADFIILDKSIIDLLTNNSDMFPVWVKSAIKIINV